MKKRWICLFVENETGVLARISGIFSGKSYNLDSLTVGITEDKTISRMTISLTSDDKTFHASVIDYSPTTVLIESIQTENRNNALIFLSEKCYANRIEIVRGGSVAIEALSIPKGTLQYAPLRGRRASSDHVYPRAHRNIMFHAQANFVQ